MRIRNLLTAIIMSAGIATAAVAQTEADYNWVGAFLIGPEHNHVVTHTASRVCLDHSICAGGSIRMSASSYNGMKLSACGLHIQTKSTKSEFIAALNCAGLDPVEV